ncbi:hypothetical protein [Kribbia dieselivorans]|uniref:hypothetical protein n=1 Tax=Kribbia dieselivorans TaxID=331526 RepID=UPI0012ED5C25|nr:hypothetical protein [Kribbia dieselivorans]
MSPDRHLEGSPAFGTYWASLLDAVDATGTPRLAGKRRDFRAANVPARRLDLESELRTLLWLHRHGLRPEFGATDGSPAADLVLPDLGLGVEVTRLARPEVGWQVVRLVFDELRRYAPSVRATVHLDSRPLAVRASVLEALREEVRLSLQQECRPVFAVLRPARGNARATTVTVTFRQAGSVVPRLFAPPVGRSSVARLDVEDLVARVLTDKRKRRQGEAMPTVLVIDVGDLMPATTRTDAQAWSRRLAHILNEHREGTSFAALCLVAFGDLSTDPRVALGVAPPSRVVSRWAEALGLGDMR